VADKPEEPGPPPQPDPLAGREQSFEEQRLVKLRERAEPPSQEGNPEPATMPAGEQAPEQAGALPPDFRQGLMEEYRKHQQAAETPGSPEPEPPQPQSPAPAPAPTPAPRSPAPRRRARK
jgi:hypothetical protein